MTLSLKALATNRVNGSVTAFKVYPVLNDVLSNITESGYWFINDNGEKQFAHKFAVQDGLSDPKKQYSFELMASIDWRNIHFMPSENFYTIGASTHENECRKTMRGIIENSCKPGGAITATVKGFETGGFVSRSVSDKALEEAIAELDKHLPAYRRSDRGFSLVNSIEWLGKVNAAHEADCVKYEAIIENLMSAFNIDTYDDMRLFAENMKHSAEVIDAARKKSTNS